VVVTTGPARRMVEANDPHTVFHAALPCCCRRMWRHVLANSVGCSYQQGGQAAAIRLLLLQGACAGCWFRSGRKHAMPVRSYSCFARVLSTQGLTRLPYECLRLGALAQPRPVKLRCSCCGWACLGRCASRFVHECETEFVQCLCSSQHGGLYDVWSGQWG
jgi:hypothetical protein